MEAITEDFVSFETAKLLKEKNCPDFGYSCICDSEGNKAQTQSIIMKWLRLTHKIYIQVFAPLYDMDCAELGVTYNVIITNLANQCLAFDTPLEDIEYNSPEEAYEAAIKYSLEHLI